MATAKSSITYTYGPEARCLAYFDNGKPVGRLIGAIAENKFMELLTTGASIQITAMQAEAYKKILIKNFHATLANKGMLDQKETILQVYDVNSTTELTIDQLKEIISLLSKGKREDRAADPVGIRMLRSDILAILTKLGVYANDNNWDKANTFCMEKTGKLMYQMDEEELKKARRQFNSILDWSVKNSKKIERQKREN